MNRFVSSLTLRPSSTASMPAIFCSFGTVGSCKNCSNSALSTAVLYTYAQPAVFKCHRKRHALHSLSENTRISITQVSI